MGKVIEFKKFSRKINKDNFKETNDDLDIFTENDLAYKRRELEITANEIDHLISCVYKQILMNEQIISKVEKDYDFEKSTYLKDFNDKLHDIMYFLTNSVYGDCIIININFLELKYLTGTLQLELEMIKESTDNTSEYMEAIEELFSRIYPLYRSWEKELL
ncbi:hypothetical protein N4T77_03215 [Clostridium sp. CX1]|uniref:Uncharacterized protein n=1 Tax=Clostridium tanneri TaxID=3037988 RepID=A0ABU4JV30_9CLOT|nr:MULTISPECIES: hypothetical protein [unclassified Clostridium]MCT8975603.1 hypothetical protein [Clostridium sp. CX1]MDW8802003.1 hypothetical protein [Clostridium sp. A1-XYC3]